MIHHYLKFIFQTEMLYLKFQDSKNIYQEKIQLRDVHFFLKNKPSMTFQKIKDTLISYQNLFKNQIIEINFCESSVIEIKFFYLQDLSFLLKIPQAAFLIANLVNQVALAFQNEKNLNRATLGEIAELESKIMTLIFSKFLVFLMKGYSDSILKNKSEEISRQKSWDVYQKNFSVLYRDAYHYYKTKKYGFKDNRKNYKILLDIKSTHRILERC